MFALNAKLFSIYELISEVFGGLNFFLYLGFFIIFFVPEIWADF